MKRVYIEKQKELKIYGDYDVVVVGGGTAGVFAAISAAEQGKKTLIVEQFGALGGSATVGLVCPLMHSGVAGNPYNSYIGSRVAKKLIELGATREMNEKNPRTFDPLVLNIILEQMCVDAGVNVLMHTYFCDSIIEDGVVKGIIIENKAGRQVITGKVFIDCTGDGDLCVRSGASYTQGNPETGKNQPISLRYTLSGINYAVFSEYLRELIEKTGEPYGTDPNVCYAACSMRAKFTMTSVFEEAIKNGDLDEEDEWYWQIFQIPGRPDSMAFNCPEFFDKIDGTNPEHLTFTQLDGKRRIMQHLKFYKKYFRGFENAYISDISGIVGIRESRNIETEYVITAADMIRHKKFDDAYAQSNYPIDVHGKVLQCDDIDAIEDDGRPYYEIPYSTIVVKGFDNLLVAGRCIGADFYAQASIRVQESVRASGEAAGIAAAMAIDEKVALRDLDGKKVRAKMEELGAEFAK